MARLVYTWKGKMVTIRKIMGKQGSLYYYKNKKRVSRVKAKKSITGIKSYRYFIKIAGKKRVFKEVIPPSVLAEAKIKLKRKRPIEGWWFLGIPSDGFNSIAVGEFPYQLTPDQVQRYVARMPEFAHIGFVETRVYESKPIATHYYTVRGRRV